MLYRLHVIISVTHTLVRHFGCIYLYTYLFAFRCYEWQWYCCT